jgi:MFS family permease
MSSVLVTVVVLPLRRVLINRNYALFMAGSFVSAMGSWFQAVAFGWIVLELTGSPLVLGLANFAQMAPLFFLGFFGGALADRVDRRTLLLWGIGTGAVALAVLAALALAGRVTVPAVLLVSLVIGLTNAVVWPAWQPFIQELVPPDRLRDAIAFNSARFNLTRVLGPAAAGLLMARVGAPACLAVAAAGSGGVLLATWLIRRPRGRRAAAPPWLSALAEGIAYVRADAFTFRLLGITGLFGVVVLPYQAFLPAFARDVLATGAEGLGVLLTAVGGGAVLGAAATGSRHVATRPGPAMALCALLAGAGLLVFALATPLHGFPTWVASAALVLVGFGSIGYLTTANATLQLRVPDHLTGRVMGLWVVMNAGTTPLGSLALGGAAERFGLPQVVLAGGLAGIAVGAYALATRAFDPFAAQQSRRPLTA